MSRARFAAFIEYKDPTTGAVKPAANASVTVYEPNSLTPLAADMYDADSGGSTLSNPLTADSSGFVEFFLDTGQRVKLVATGAGLGTVTLDYEPVHPDPVDVVQADAIGVLRFLEQSSVPDTPAAGSAKLWFDDDGNFYMRFPSTLSYKLPLSTLIANADIAAGAAIALSKLAATTAGLVRSNGTVIAGGATVVNADVDAAAAIALSKLAAGSAGLLRSNGTAISAGHANIANADIDAAAAIALSKLAATTSGLVRSNGTVMAGGATVATADIDANAVTQARIAVGVSSGVNTTSATYVDLTDMDTGDFTTFGGNLLVWFNCTTYNSNAGAVNLIGLSLDGAAVVADIQPSIPAVNATISPSIAYLFTGVSAGTHRVKTRWATNAGTAHMLTTLRRQIVLELKK